MDTEDTPACAACGQPTPSRAAFLFYKGRRWVFCTAACRLAFKRDAATLADRHPERGLAPYPGQPAPAPAHRETPFTSLIGRSPDRPGQPDQGKT